MNGCDRILVHLKLLKSVICGQLLQNVGHVSLGDIWTVDIEEECGRNKYIGFGTLEPKNVFIREGN